MMTKKIKSVDLLPDFLQTDKNQKFLSSTLDQLIQNPSLERLDGFVGSKLSPNYNNSSDNYIQDFSAIRQNYQLSPALIVNDKERTVTDVVSFDDLVNQIKFYGGYVDNFDRLFETEYYSYKPLIDWDKFVNYQEYYWLVTGPQTVTITGKIQTTTSTFTVSENISETSFVFTPDGQTEDPIITLYRGNTYIFNVTSNQNFYIKTIPTIGTGDLYTNNVINNGTSTGQITLIVDEETPASLYYIGSSGSSTQGQFLIRKIEQDTVIDVENEILNKKSYTSGTGIKLTNGMKIQFGGTVIPESYKNKQYFVEGVGDSIKLIDYNLLSSSADMADLYNDNFDITPFDSFPYDSFKNLPLDPEYITINRASKDLNPWSRYNRWVHTDVIKISAEANGQLPVYPADKRAKRPIIEFLPNLQLYNFGSIGQINVDLIDTTTLDAFSSVEGSAGYYVDEVLLEQGHRVIFNADNDDDVRGKIFVVNYVFINGKKTLELNPAVDHTPPLTASISVNLGKTFEGTNWWYNGSEWLFAQQHKTLNESPLFDLFDNFGQSYSLDLNTDFKGNKIFGYTPGTIKDSVLGFSVKQETSRGIGSYSFKNYLMTESFGLIENQSTIKNINTYQAFVKINSDNGAVYKNSWTPGSEYKIPVIQFSQIAESTSTIVVDAVDFSQATTAKFNVYINNEKINSSKYITTVTNNIYSINFNDVLSQNTNVLIKITSDGKLIESKGYYELPVSMTNNPDNGIVNELTLSEIGNHTRRISEVAPDFIGQYPGDSNLRDLSGVDGYANQIITNVNPGLFSSFFIGKSEHSVIDALGIAADNYNRFKLSLIKKISEISNESDPVLILDLAIKEINIAKTKTSSYYLSDMIGYGTDKNVKKWNITNTNNKIYPLQSTFNLSTLSLKSVLIYLNNIQLIVDKDYKFLDDSSIELLVDLSVGDTVSIVDYFSTEGSFVPSTPTKLGLYPKFEPKIYVDDTYINGPTKVIQGHDGSITMAFDDYRDDVLLEFEKRVYNNVKAQYRHELLDFNSVIPGAFRKTDYSLAEINDLLQKDFVKWAGQYGVEYVKNTVFDINNSFTWNYTGAYNTNLNLQLTGYWRAVYRYFYDTDRPHTHPWEMLGFGSMPKWWEEEYGTAPYTSGNDILWNDLELGNIKQGPRQGIDSKYSRPGLQALLPVNEYGQLVDPTINIAINITPYNQRQNFVFGDQGPAETTWRKSSYWPFTVQKMLALTKPSLYCALMYDVANLTKNIADQWTYGSNQDFLSLKKSIVPVDNLNLTAGYSVYIVESGKQKFTNYVDMLLTDIENYEINLFHKVGGFVSKNKLQIIIDAYDPLSKAPGAILPQEDYRLILNTSNPIKSLNVSGIIVQKVNGKFVLKGYDTFDPYFTIFTPIRNENTPTITIGGVSAPYVNWTDTVTGGNTGLTDADLTTANGSTTSRYYQQGQIVLYQNKFYVVKVSHTARPNFNPTYFQQIPSLPIYRGATVQIENSFDRVENRIPYGTEFSKIQEVYDVIIGYGAWLEYQGFIFDQFNAEFNDVMNWKFSGKEFLYWTTQNWANNNIIALSPFADQLKFKSKDSIVDNIFNSNYRYGISQVNGSAFSQKNLSVVRDDGLCTINTVDTAQGMYFVRLSLVQKEHAIVFNNTTIFNDTIYDAETGYRQLRVKFVGFRTRNWNGDYFSPGFVYDNVQVKSWEKYKTYKNGDVVKYAGKFYSAIKNTISSNTFDFNDWAVLNEEPKADLLPNFDYKIRQFDDFYSLDIDNFDSAQQVMAQHLIGYTPRVYFNNIFTNPISQYKFYQGFIKEKGTKNSLSKLAKASIQNLQGELTFNEVWAFRVGHFGSYQTFKEIEFPLVEGTFVDNPQIINFVDNTPTNPNDLIYYQPKDSLLLKPKDYISSTTFNVVSSTFDDNNLKIKTAGYVRLDDVTATAFNESSLFDIANNGLITEGDIIWLGFRTDGEWDVLRYNKSLANVISALSNDEGTEITLTTDQYHDLSIGTIVSITQLDPRINGVYKVKKIPALNQFVIETTQITIDIREESLNSPGLLFKFTSQRFNSFNDLYKDSIILDFSYGTKFWIDRDKNDKWAVYEKIKNYKLIKTEKSTVESSDTNQFGYNLTQRKNSKIVLISSPNFYDQINYGKVYVYEDSNEKLKQLGSFILNESKVYHTPGTKTEFGYATFYDTREFKNSGYGLFFIGAPATSNVISNFVTGGVRLSTGTGVTSLFVQEGAVKINSFDPILLKENTTVTTVLLSPFPSSYQRFGQSIYVQSNTSTKLTLIGAPGTLTTGSGRVFAYNVVDSTVTNLEIVAHPSGIELAYNGTIPQGSQWGYSISGSDDSKVIAISAPGYPGINSQKGMVQIFSGTTYIQTLDIPTSIENKSRFGEKIVVTPDGNDVFVSAPYSVNQDNSIGKVLHYKKDSLGQFKLNQTITNPVPGQGMNFGASLDLNKNKNLLVITALGTNNRIQTTFDIYSEPSTVPLINDPESDFKDLPTLLDARSTTFYEGIKLTGSVYLYDNKDSRYVLADEIFPRAYYEGNNYGHSVIINDNSIYIGAPSYSTSSNTSYVYAFNKIDKNVDGYKVLRSQSDLVDIELFNRVVLIDTSKEEITEYLDLIDPVKGKIAGLAEQELTYKSENDPAIYSIGSDATNNDETSNWLDDHVGELWWDLSSVKYLWYEQGDLNFRKNSWGKVFPGATIDVYEWVRSEYLPSEWSALADTAQGLVNAISGQPKYPDNTVISVKQVLDPVTGTFINVYYYWVKNKVTIPVKKNRRISGFEVANIIADPVTYGLKTLQVISPESITLANVSNQLVDDRIILNIAFDEINNKIPRHTEWLLLQENSELDFPNTLLEKKLIDSLIGHDRLGNVVPDPTLSFRERYGINVRPQQTMFKNRFEALRNIIEFVNSILIKYPITDKCSFINLNKEEMIPNESLNQYDVIVEDLDYLSLEVPNPSVLKTAKLTAFVKNGKIYNVSIENSGFGYRYPPTVSITDNENNMAVIETEIDNLGQVIKVNIVNAGKEFNTAPQLTVRPFTAVVLVDENSSKRWGKYVYNSQLKLWTKIATQKFNTKLYWNYVNWTSDNYNPYVDYSYTVNDVYQLKTLPNIVPGEYIKIKNGGSGRYIIVEKTQPNVFGTFDNDYNLVYSENGTIQIDESIWNFINGNLAFDQNNRYDQTLYDQTPDIETYNIFLALKNDIFIDELKTNWNLLFFKAVKYALSEQKLLDWAFKTSFINVINKAGPLSQKPVYKLENSSYYEDYLKEVKPYHSIIRNFTTNYSNIEPSNTYITDFDKPTVYNNDSGKFEVINIDNSLMDEYPWKSWKDNYKYYVDSIVVADGGSGYTAAPTVSIEAVSGDTGTGAKARAFVSSGKISEIQVIDAGKGYTQPPNVILTGGGSNIKPARVYARLANNQTRKNTIGITFDRISSKANLNDNFIVDTFVCDGYTKEFVLSWLAQPNKLNFAVTLNGNLVLSTDYTIRYYKQSYNGYNKKFSKIVFLNGAPAKEKILKIEYTKSFEILNAVEKINYYYTVTNTSTNIGKDIHQLMEGTDFPYNQIIGLPFDYTSKWDVEFQPFGKFSYADSVEFSNVYTVNTTATTGSYVLSLTTTTGIQPGFYANIISYITPKFSSSTVRVVSITGNSVTFNNSLTSIVHGGKDKIEIWKEATSPYLLDTDLDGGAWSTQTGLISNAFGVNPEDVIVSNDGFYTQNTLYSTEELVPGFVTDTLGINVYTKQDSGAPIIISGQGFVTAGNITYIKLDMLPPSGDYITVVFDNRQLVYNPNVSDPVTDLTDSTQFAIDWENKNLIISEQLINGIVGYTVLGIGISEAGAGAGFIDKKVSTVLDTFTAEIISDHSIDSVGSAYVTVNGVSLSKVTTTTDIGFVFGTSDDGSGRAAVYVNFNSYFNKNTIQAYFFSDEYKYFNEIKRQIFNVDGTPQTIFVLDHPPGVSEPSSANIIVELTNNLGTRRLRPPYISYYDVSNSINTVFPINIYSSNVTKYNINSFDITNVKVYVNGQALRPGFDYSIISGTGNVSLNSNFVKTGNVIAVECLLQGLTSEVQFDYTVVGNNLILQNSVTDSVINTITYNDNDGLLVRTERFIGNPNRRYRISRPVLNDNYVWVQVNGVSLTSGLDFEILDDQVTVQISDAYSHTINDEVIIISISSKQFATTVLGYRIFNDIFNRTHFKRLSKQHTTYLTKELYFTDTEIHVADAMMLTGPIPSKKIPGVILLDGERIEFNKIEGNVLKQLRRSTLGTAPSYFCEAGTKVIDQGINQTIPYTEKTLVQKIITTSTNTYKINDGLIKIDLFGDSLVCGRDPTRTPPPIGTCRNGDLVTGRTDFPPDILVYNYLNSLGYNVEVTTRAAGGSSATNLLLGTDNVNPPFPQDVDADIVLFNYAFNDRYRGGTTSSYRQSLITLRNLVPTGTTVVWMAPVPYVTILLTNSELQEFGSIMKEVASQYGDIIADPGVIGTSTWATYITVDGLHPSQAGYNAMVNQAIGPAMKLAVDSILNPIKQQIGDPIKLSTEFNSNDQIKVFYGGRPLRKFGQYYQDISQSFDSPQFNIKGNLASTDLLPITAIQYDSYLITATNQVWVYTGSKKLNSINGFEYNGLNYSPQEFNVNTSTQQIELNITGGVKSGVKLTITKKEFRRDSSWNNELTTSTTLSLLDSTTPQAEFLQKEPAELPDDYYYGGSRYILDYGDQILRDENDDPLEEGF